MGMDSQPADWLAGSFFRSPMWRMLRVSYRSQHRLPRIDDAWVEIALRLQTTPDDRHLTPAIRAAFELWRADQTARWLLEAHLLTTRSLAEVATACELPEAAVDAFHELLFHARPRLQASDWVLAVAVRSTPANDFAGPQPRGLWKYAAFVGGPLVLDVIVAVTRKRGRESGTTSSGSSGGTSHRQVGTSPGAGVCNGRHAPGCVLSSG
jgi:hypothetical protein